MADKYINLNKSTDFPVNKKLCYKCRFRHKNGDPTQHDVYLCNYMQIKGHSKPTRDTDGGDICGSFEPDVKKSNHMVGGRKK